LILIIDHFDSFSHNLYQSFAQLEETRVVRCDQIDLQEISNLKPSLVVLSPGPKGPKDTGITPSYLTSTFGEHCPTLGICLGFQAMSLQWGGQVEQAKDVVHGKTLHLKFQPHEIFKNCPNPMGVARYHSLCVPSLSLSVQKVNILAEHENMAMAVLDKKKPWIGLQFHPESFLTPQGTLLLSNIHRYLSK
jgi:anthranilate synthase/aminodeoxychorismate synthase-like glutamine amidotransferase